MKCQYGKLCNSRARYDHAYLAAWEKYATTVKAPRAAFSKALLRSNGSDESQDTIAFLQKNHDMIDKKAWARYKADCDKAWERHKKVVDWLESYETEK